GDEKERFNNTRQVHSEKTLFRNPESRKRLIGPDGLLNCVRDTVGLLVDLLEFPAFDEQANFWLGAGVTQEHTAFAGEFFLDFIHQLHHCWQFGEGWFFFYEQVALGLWILL